MAEDRVVADLVQFGVERSAPAQRQVHCLPAADLHVEPHVAASTKERNSLIVKKCFTRSLSCSASSRRSPRTPSPSPSTANRRNDPGAPAADPSGRAWRTARSGGEQLVHQPAVEVEPLGSAARAVGKTRGHATEKRYAVAPRSFISATSSL